MQKTDYLKKAIPLKTVFNWLGISVENNGDYRCPIHGKDTRASAKYYDDTDSAYCWGCGKPFDIFEIVKDYFKISFRETIEKLEVQFDVKYDVKIEKKEKVLSHNKIKDVFRFQYDNRMGEFIYKNKIKNLAWIKEVWDEKNRLDYETDSYTLEEIKRLYSGWYSKYRDGGNGNEKGDDIYRSTGDNHLGNF